MNCKGYYYIIVLLGLFIGVNLQAQHSISNTIDEASVIGNSSETVNVTDTHLAADKVLYSNERLENYKKYDGFGFGMTITAMGAVFLGLIGLYLLFNVIGSIAVSLSHKRAMKFFGMSKEEAKDIAKKSGDIYAAIALAIYEATELHDEENTILTIKNTVRNYSPWSSKIYTLRETPKK